MINLLKRFDDKPMIKYTVSIFIVMLLGSIGISGAVIGIFLPVILFCMSAYGIFSAIILLPPGMTLFFVCFKYIRLICKENKWSWDW